MAGQYDSKDGFTRLPDLWRWWNWFLFEQCNSLMSWVESMQMASRWSDTLTLSNRHVVFDCWNHHVQHFYRQQSTFNVRNCPGCNFKVISWISSRTQRTERRNLSVLVVKTSSFTLRFPLNLLGLFIFVSIVHDKSKAPLKGRTLMEIGEDWEKTHRSTNDAQRPKLVLVLFPVRLLNVVYLLLVPLRWIEESWQVRKSENPRKRPRNYLFYVTTYHETFAIRRTQVAHDVSVKTGHAVLGEAVHRYRAVVEQDCEPRLQHVLQRVHELRLFISSLQKTWFHHFKQPSRYIQDQNWFTGFTHRLQIRMWVKKGHGWVRVILYIKCTNGFTT